MNNFAMLFIKSLKIFLMILLIGVVVGLIGFGAMLFI
tara:strand:+ start:1022 stop:1132 length:111 start_codon:yes stop_codon:yes gene_type:complete